MAPPVIRKANGDEIALTGNSPLRGLSAGEQKTELLAVDTVSLTLETTDPLDISIGDTLVVFSNLYTLNTLPTVTRNARKQLVYDFVFEGPQYHLLRVVYFDTDVNGSALSSEFALTGNLSLFATVLITNMARVFGGAWGLGDVLIPGEPDNNGTPGTPVSGQASATKTLTFESENCLGVLQRLCTEFNTEFEIEYRPLDAPNRVLHIRPAGQVRNQTFSYGQGNGLYTLSRQSAGGEGFVTKLYAFGSDKNLPADYRGFATRLQLPLPDPNNPPAQSSPWDSFVSDSAGITAYGLIEGTKVFDEISPLRAGTINGVGRSENLIDTDLGFNLYEISGSTVVNGVIKPVYTHLIPGIAPKVNFLTGGLAGYTFEVRDSEPTRNWLYLNPFTDENGLTFPDPAADSPFSLQTGDTFVLIDIMLPTEYVTAAEEKLLAAATAYLNEHNRPALKYSLTLDELYLQDQAGDFGLAGISTPPNFFTVGDSIRVVDTGLGIDRYARIIGLTRDVLRPYRYTLELGDTVRISLLERVLSRSAEVKAIIKKQQLDLNQGGSTIPTKSDVNGQIDTKLRPIGRDVTYTLSAGVFPAGVFPDLNDLLKRHQLQAGVSLKTLIGDPLSGKRDMIGRVRQLGTKITFPL